MKRVCVVVAGVLLLKGMAFAEGVVWEKISREHDRLLCSIACSGEIYCGSRRYLLKSSDAGATWRFAGVKGAVYDLDARAGTVYAAGERGFFASSNGNRWQRLSAVPGYKIAALEDTVFLAGTKGLLSSSDGGRTWSPVSPVQGQRILAMAVSGAGTVCVVTPKGLYRRDADGSWVETLSFVSGEEETSETETEQEEQDEEHTGSRPARAALAWSEYDARFILVREPDMFASADDGRTWEHGARISGRGELLSLISPGRRLFAAGTRGVFEYTDGVWKDRVSGLGTGTVHEMSVASGFDGKAGLFLYAASESGLYRASLSGTDAPGGETVTAVSRSEPSVDEVFREAIRYAEVAPDKIRDWRRKAAAKAWLPQVRLAVDRDTSDLWHWEGGSTTREGDDLLVRGEDSVNWDVALTWDLSELVWSTDQTSIDVRSRLMVELRDDILDQVTRCYFERLRVMHELDTLDAGQADTRFEKELKVRELTASLDALTGGYFSERIL